MKYLFSIAIILLALTSCEIEKDGIIEGRMNIVCTTSISGDAVKNIVGDQADVVILMGPGVDPHEYTPRQKDMDLISEADVLVYHGLYLEGKMTETIEKHKKNGNHVINMGDALTDEDILDFEEGAHADHGHNSANGNEDPHVWNSVPLWIKCINYTAKQLGAIQPKNKVTYLDNASTYESKLAELHQELVALYSSIPDSSRILITAHDAFGYLAETYGLKVRGLQGISTTAEFGIRDISNLSEFIRKNNIRSVFLETSVPNRNIQAVIDNCRTHNHDVRIAGTLYSDALGDPSGEAGTYIGMMRANAKEIVNALK